MFADKIVLVTGVGGGIGNAIAYSFSKEVKHLITASRSSNDEVWGSDFHSTAQITHLSHDLTDEKHVTDLFEYIKATFKRLDVVINTIGGSLYSHKIEDFSMREYDEIMGVNLRSAFMITKSAIKMMKYQSPLGGNVVHFVSSSAKVISENKAPYGVAKAGLARLIQYAAVEAAEYQIKVNGITPTYVFTPRHERELEQKAKKTRLSKADLIAHAISGQILKQTLHPEDLLPVTRLLAETNVITGQIYDVSLGEVLNY